MPRPLIRSGVQILALGDNASNASEKVSPGSLSIMHIRRAIPEDSPAILQVEALVHGEEVTSKYDLPMFIRFGQVFIAEESGVIIGAIVGLNTTQNEIKVNDWFVHPVYQRQGIGVQLYRQLIAEVTGWDILAIVLKHNERSLRLHQKLGFVIEQEIEDPFQIGDGNGFLMRLRKDNLTCTIHPRKLYKSTITQAF